MSNLQLRVISAVVLAIVALGLTWLGGLPFRLLCAVMSAMIFYEWTRMSRPAAADGLGLLPEALMVIFVGALIAGLSALWLLPLVVILVAITATSAGIRKIGQWDAGGLAYA
ncbi:phosphatidate cytidylyltransferase, partial [Mesorhizobium sp. M8A.F.Ca.ET.023.01.1.1]